MYVSNENNQDVTAYFDDIQVRHKQTSVAVATDYYPFGMPMDGREMKRKDWRYGYQGEHAEKDEESGWNQFQLRVYDPIIGRWLSVDPEREFSSPYVNVANNPVSGTDPTGGISQNPIHGSDGKFRGYDSKGVGGEIIVYDGKFSAGMSQQKILNNGGSLKRNFLKPEIFFEPSIPKPIDLAKDNSQNILDNIVNWSMYINYVKRKPDGSQFNISEVISNDAVDNRHSIIKFFDFGSMSGTNSNSRTITFKDGSTAIIKVLDADYKQNHKRNSIDHVYHGDESNAINSILFKNGRYTTMYVNFSNHKIYKHYVKKATIE